MVKEIRFCKFKRLVVWTKGNSVPETPSYGTGYIFIRRHSVPETPSCGTRRVLGSIRYAEQASVVRKRYSVPETPFCGTRRVFRGTRYRKRPPTVRGTSSEHCTGKGLFLSGVCCLRCRQCSPFSGSLKNSVPERASSGTEYARGAKNRLLWYATHLQKHSV